MSQDKGILGISTEQFDRVLKTNLYAMFWLCKAAIPHLAEGSAIINTASIQAFDPSPQLLDYATTKAGIANFTKALAADLAEQGIRVNAVAPGPVWTPLIPSTMPEEKVKQFGTDTPEGAPASRRSWRRRTSSSPRRNPATSPARSWASRAADRPSDPPSGRALLGCPPRRGSVR